MFILLFFLTNKTAVVVVVRGGRGYNKCAKSRVYVCKLLLYLGCIVTRLWPMMCKQKLFDVTSGKLLRRGLTRYHVSFAFLVLSPGWDADEMQKVEKPCCHHVVTDLRVEAAL